MTDLGGNEQQEPTTVRGYVTSFKTAPKSTNYVTRAIIKNKDLTALCMWRHEFATDLQFITRKEYSIRGVLRTKNGRHYMIQPNIEEVTKQRSPRHAEATSKKGHSLAKLGATLSVLLLIFSASAYGLYIHNNSEANRIELNVNSQSRDTSASTGTVNTPSKPQEPRQSQPSINVDNLFSVYDSTYDQSTGSYSFDYDDLTSYFSDYGVSDSSLNNATYRSGDETWTINCSKYTNSCTAYSSSGASASTYCSRYINSCSTYGSDGSSYNTSCSKYTNNCSTNGSDGYSSNTYCSSYTNNCSTNDSYGNSSSTYCSRYINNCSTYGSDGSYSNTYCSSYSTSCSTYGSDGYSSYLDW
jgi:hypothetical protein